MMDNLSDVYYLALLIARQIFVYLRDLFLREFSWLATTSDDFEFGDYKMHNLATKHVTADLLAFSVICVLLFLLVLLASKCEKGGEQDYASMDMDTLSVNHEDDLPFFSSTDSSTQNFLHACGDSIYLHKEIPLRNPPILKFTERQSTESANLSRRSSRKSRGAQSLQCQGTQTTDKIFEKTHQEWLVRRTRSGQIYGKFPE